jgi:AraC-like DNA-binding protein
VFHRRSARSTTAGVKSPALLCATRTGSVSGGSALIASAPAGQNSGPASATCGNDGTIEPVSRRLTGAHVAGPTDGPCIRLDRIRDELLQPGNAHVPVSVLAARWAYDDPSVFSRAFTRQFG